MTTTKQIKHKLPIQPLLEKVREFVHSYIMGDDDMPISPLSKFYGLALIAELYDKVYYLDNDRRKHLGRYFGNDTLRVDLECIMAIEDLQQELGSTIRYVWDLDNHNDDFGKRFLSLYENGLDTTLPSLKDSKIWRGNSDCSSASLRFQTVFHKAQESLAEPERESEIINLKKTEEEHERIASMQKKLLKNRYAHKAKDISVAANQFNYADCILSVQKQIESVDLSQIQMELNRALEMLRQVFMTDAQDIYYIRTGETDAITNDANREIIHECYTEIPLRDYFNEREDAREELLIQMDTEIEEWRIQNKRTGKPFLRNEHLKYLQQQLETVFASMQQDYPDLWKLREHSGGLDSEVTVDNFARMFYKRANVDHEFLELQWKAELLSELIAEDEKKKAREPINYSPEESAVNQFVDNIMKIANMLYSEYEGKTITTGAHMPDAEIHIQVLELQRFLDQEREQNYDEFRSWCFPQNAKSIQMFCQYIIQLKDAGYFGQLRKDLIASVVAAVIGREVGTITNYLSKKQD